MAGFTFSTTRNDISPALTELVASAKNKEPVLRAMGTTFMSITMGNFNSVGRAYRPTPWKPKADGSVSNLQSRNPVLSKSFQLTVTGESATVSNPMKYAPVLPGGQCWQTDADGGGKDAPRGRARHRAPGAGDRCEVKPSLVRVFPLIAQG
jgi:hypothetical protein